MCILEEVLDDESWRSMVAAIRDFLADSNDKGASAEEVAGYARTIALAAEFAKLRRGNKRIRQARNTRKIEISRHDGKRTIKGDLLRIKAAAVKGDLHAFGVAFTEASPAAQHRVGGPLTLNMLLDRGRVLSAIDAALTAPDLAGRPRDRELDGLVGVLLAAYEATVGPATATRSPDARRAARFSEAHAFLLDASRLLDLRLVGPGDDARLRRVLRNRSAAKNRPFAG